MIANYGADSLFDKHKELRVATEVARRSDIFSEQMEECGHERQFNSDDVSADGVRGYYKESLTPPVENCDLESASESEDEPIKIEVRTTADKEDLEDLLHPQESLTLPISGIMIWLEDKYRGSRGFELGTLGSNLLSAIMKEQSRRWEALALGYISDVIVMTHSFILGLLEGICIDGRVKSGLMSVLVDGLVERYGKAREQVQFLLDIERAGRPATLNHYFNDNLDKWYVDLFLQRSYWRVLTLAQVARNAAGSC